VGQGRLLARLLLHPDDRVGVRELARQTGLALATVSREVGLLVDAGILKDQRIGRNRLVQVDAASPLVGPMTELVTLTFGPREVLADSLRDMGGVDAAYVFGSWAARYQGERGRPPNDIDVLIIGDPDRRELDDALERAEQVLRRPVHPTVRPTFDRNDRFIDFIGDRPIVPIELHGEQDSS
jgi:predicted nucleotidyltransferase